MRTRAHPFTPHLFPQGPGLTSLPPPATLLLPLQPHWFPALGGHRVLGQSLLAMAKAKNSGC